MSPLLRDVVGTVRNWPVFGFYVAATLVAAAIIGLITVDVIDLDMQHFGEESHRTHDVAYGALFTTLVVGVVAQLRRPYRNVAGMVMAQVPGAALLLTAVLAGQVDRVFEFNPLRYAAALAAVTALVHPSGRAVLRTFGLTAVSWPMVALTGVATVPLLALASTNIRQQRGVPDPHTFMGHYGFMAALAYAIIGISLLASLRPAGWRLPACVAALLAAVLGGTSLLYPDAASSLDWGWALAAIAGGAALVALVATQGARGIDPLEEGGQEVLEGGDAGRAEMGGVPGL